MVINGIEELQAKFKKCVTLDDVKMVVKVNGNELNVKMEQNTASAFNKGYSTGDTARSIITVLTDGGMTSTTKPQTNYAAYVEYGTRFMEAEPFVRPAFDAQKTQFLDDLRRMMK